MKGRKLETMVEVLGMLDRRERLTVPSLMAEFSLSERTILRYMQELSLHFPVIYDRHAGSYAFMEGYSLQKMRLTPREYLTLALARNFVKPLGGGFERSLAEIEGKLSHRQGLAIDDAVVVRTDPQPDAVSERVEAITAAVMERRTVSITYRSASSGRTGEREVDPYFLFFNDGVWYLRGWCHKARRRLTFALDCIERLSVTGRFFTPPAFSSDDELKHAFGAWLDGEPTRVVLRFDGCVKRQVQRKAIPDCRSRELPDGRLELRFTVKGTEGVRQWLYGWIPFVEVVGPAALRATVTEDLEAALARHRRS